MQRHSNAPRDKDIATLRSMKGLYSAVNLIIGSQWVARTRWGLMFSLLMSSAGWSADVIVLSNGDQVRGEIKELTKKVIVISTDYSDGDFRIKWEKVAWIERDRTFLVEKFSGDRLAGSIKSDTTSNDAIVGGEKVALNDPMSGLSNKPFGPGWMLGSISAIP